MNKRHIPRNNPGRRPKTSIPFQLTGMDIDAGLNDLAESGLIKFVQMPDGEVRIFAPHAPAPACNGSLVWEG